MNGALKSRVELVAHFVPCLLVALCVFGVQVLDYGRKNGTGPPKTLTLRYVVDCYISLLPLVLIGMLINLPVGCFFSS